MTSEKIDKLKLFADEIRSRLRVIETKQDHQESLINAINLKVYIQNKIDDNLLRYEIIVTGIE